MRTLFRLGQAWFPPQITYPGGESGDRLFFWDQPPIRPPVPFAPFPYAEEPLLPSLPRQGYPFTMPAPGTEEEEYPYPEFGTDAKPYDVTRFFVPTGYPSAFPGRSMKGSRGWIPTTGLWAGRF